jgi:hypothetical protein
MRLPHLLVIAMSFLALPVAADPYLNRDKLIELVLAGNVDAVEAGISATHAARKNGDVPVERMRDLFRIFQSHSPQTVKFVGDWTARFPGSGYAAMAQGSVIYEAAFTMRGNAVSRFTSPHATERFNALVDAAALKFVEAYEIEPDLVPLVDRLLFMGGRGLVPLDVTAVADRAMAETPTAGTMYALLSATDPLWGGNPKDAPWLCDQYAAAVPEWKSDPTTICMLIFVGQYLRFEPRDWFLTEADGIDDPTVQGLRAKAVTFRISDDPAWVAEAVELFNSPDATDMTRALHWDERIRNSDRPRVAHLVQPRAIAAARARLKWDPYHVGSLDILTHPYIYTVNEDGFRVSTVNRTEAYHREVMDLLDRWTTVQPWSSAAWERRANVLSFRPDRARNGDKRYEAYVRAVVHSNYAPQALGQMVFGMELVSQGGSDPVANCAVARALRLGEAVCEASKSRLEGCHTFHFGQDRAQALVIDLDDGGQCYEKVTGPISSAAFTEDDMAHHPVDPIVFLGLDRLLTDNGPSGLR